MSDPYFTQLSQALRAAGIHQPCLVLDLDRLNGNIASVKSRLAPGLQVRIVDKSLPCLRLLDHIRGRIASYQEETGHMYNLEATPAEGTTYRFAKEDRKRYPDILQAGTQDAPYYTNSTQLPVGYTDDAFEALEQQDELQRKYTGGTVLHLYMAERISSADACRNLVRRALTRFRLPYITVTPTFSICPKHGYLAGEHEFCPRCDEEALARKSAAA